VYYCDGAVFYEAINEFIYSLICAVEVQNSVDIFPYPGSQDITSGVDYGLRGNQGTKAPTYSAMCPFPLCVALALCDQNPTKLQT